MTVRLLVFGKAAPLIDVFEIPFLGEVLMLDDVDFVVTNIRLNAEIIGQHEIPHLYLLPVCRVDAEAA